MAENGVVRGIMRAFDAFRRGDADAEAEVWLVSVRGRPFYELAAEWVRERGRAFDGPVDAPDAAEPEPPPPPEAVAEAPPHLTLEDVRQDALALERDEGRVGSDLHLGSGRSMLRFRSLSGAWLAYWANPVSGEAGAMPTRWWPLPDDEKWPRFPVDDMAEAPEELAGDAMRLLERRRCMVHDKPLLGCGCPTIYEVLRHLHLERKASELPVDDRPITEVLGADLPTFPTSGVSAPSRSGSPTTKSTTPGGRASAPGEEDDRPPAPPAAATPSSPEATSASPPAATPGTPAVDPRAVAARVAEGKPPTADLPARFGFVCECGASGIADDPEAVCTRCGNAAPWTHAAADPSTPGPGYARVVLVAPLSPGELEAARRAGAVVMERCAICAQPIHADGEPPLRALRFGKLVVAAHLACAVEHAPPTFRVAGSRIPCTRCRQPVEGEAVTGGYGESKVRYHADARACAGPPPPPLAKELGTDRPEPEEPAAPPAAAPDDPLQVARDLGWKGPLECGRRLKARCVRIKCGQGETIEKGQKYMKRGDDVAHVLCLTLPGAP